MEKKYYKHLDIIRIFSCVIILLYHMGILKGGYLAVCTFFALSGYLSCLSAFKKEKFSLLSYYKSRLLKIYIPLLIIVFISIPVVSLFKNINWFSLKPETTSVLLGYNNIYQLGANLDYFARHIDSPFMHLWYISILFQFELVFPFIFILLKKIGDKFHKIVPIIITLVASIASYIFFYKLSIGSNLMEAYYNTFARSFSWFLGLFLGFIHSYYGPIVSSIIKNKKISKFIFFLYVIIFCELVFLVDANSKFFAISMLISTIITLHLIDYGDVFDKQSKFDKFIKSLSSMSYEIYLVQYPIIFIFQYINISFYLKFILIIILVLILSYIIHFSLDKNKKFKVLRNILKIILVIVCLIGIYQYIITKNHTKEMKALEEQLAQSEEAMKKKQEEYAAKLKKEQENFNKILEELDESKLEEIITNMNIVGVGDSVMLGAVDNLYNKFPNGYFDAAISRTAWVLNDILIDLKKRDMLGNTIVLNLGANGDCTNAQKIQIMKTCSDKKVFWINVTNDSDVHVNKDLALFADKYENLYVIDWETISKGHSEYFYSDGIHLTPAGREVYVNTIYESIYKVYLDEYNARKDAALKDYENAVKNKISFYGNGLLLNSFDIMQENFKEDNFIINKDFDFNELKLQINKSIENNSITNKIVLVIDSSLELTKENYEELIKMCFEQEIYIVTLTKKDYDNIDGLNYENVKIINFYDELKQNSNYLMVDKIHLTNDGNKALSKLLKDTLKPE